MRIRPPAAGWAAIGRVGRGGPRVALTSARRRSRGNAADLGRRRARLGGDPGSPIHRSIHRPIGRDGGTRRPWRGRAVPARHEVRRRHLDDDRQPGLADGAEDGRPRRDLLPDGRRSGLAHHPVRRRGPARGRRAGGAGRRRPDGPGRPGQPDVPPGPHRAARPVADHRDLRDRPRAVQRARDIAFTARDRGRYSVYVVHDPALSNSRGNDSGATVGHTLVATDPGTKDYPAAASALAAAPAVRGDVQRLPRHQRRLDRPAGGRPARRPLRDRGGRQPRADRAAAVRPARPRDAGARLRRRRRGRARGLARLAAGRLHRRGARRTRRDGTPTSPTCAGRPASLRTATERQLYRVSTMVLAASEDKTYRGAYVASPSSPWAFGRDDPSGPYHLVWSRDLYQIASSLALAGDTAGANRALDFLFDVQQKPDGSFPQNSRVDGTPFWGGLQLDEVRLPIVLAHQLGRSDASTWSHVKRAADFLLVVLAGRQPRAVDAPGALGEPVRVLAGDHRRRDRRSGVCRADRRGQRRRGLGPPVPGHSRRLAVARQGLDRDDHGPVLQRAVLPAPDQGRQPERRHDVRHRRQRPDERRPAGRGRPQLPRTGPPRRAAGRRPGRGQHPRRGRPAARRPDRPRPVLAPGVVRRLRREARRVAVGLRPARRFARAPAAAPGRCSTASAASTRSPTAALPRAGRSWRGSQRRSDRG